MKKKLIIFSCVFGGILILLSTALILFCTFFNVYTLSPENCRTVFGVYPEEFKEKIHFVTYTYQSVDSNGNLKLVMSDSDVENFRSAVPSLFLKGDKNVGTKIISEDYTELTIMCYKETCVDDTFSSASVIRECVIAQFLNGKNLEPIEVTCKFVDAVTNEVKHQFTYSSKNFGKIDVDVDPEKFSSIEDA